MADVPGIVEPDFGVGGQKLQHLDTHIEVRRLCDSQIQ